MPSETSIHIASCLRKGLDDISESWADVIADFYPPETTRDDLERKSRIAIEIIANLLDGESYDSYSNFFRKLALEWISVDGSLDDLKTLKKRFLEICEKRFLFLEDISESPESLAKSFDSILEKELWPFAAVDYLAVYESEVGDNLKNLPDSNTALRCLLDLTGRLGGMFDTADIWEELLSEIREVFPSMDAGAVFLYSGRNLKLKGIVGFEDFLLAKNQHDLDFSFYHEFDRRMGITVTNVCNLDDPSKLVFMRRKLVDDKAVKEYPSQMLSMPLVSSDNRKGLICLYGFNRKSFFLDDELELLEILQINIKSALTRSETIASLRENRRDNEFLVDLQKKLSGMNDPIALGNTFLNAISTHIGEMRSVIYRNSGSNGNLELLSGLNTIEVPNTTELSTLYTFSIERKAPIFLSGLQGNPVLEGIMPPKELVSEGDDGVLGIIPLMAGSELVGIWGFLILEPAELSESKRLFLTLAANLFTYSFKDIMAYLEIRHQHEIRGKEINLAASLQQHLVPRYHRGQGYEIEISLIAGGDLAGDFAFLETLKDDGIIVAIGDVSGRGIAAGMSMMSTYGLLGELSKSSSSPGVILERLNNRLREQFDKTLPPFLDETFVTGYIIKADENGKINYAKAGHLPPIIYRAQSDAEETLDAHGVPLGIFADSRFEEHETIMNPGDVILMYTDGITEARDENGEEFGVERLQELVKRWHSYPPRVLRKMISFKLRQFIPPDAAGDDRTWIVLSREKSGWKDFVVDTSENKRRVSVSEILDYIGQCGFIKDKNTYGNLFNESVRIAQERGQNEIAARIFADDDSLHIVIEDNDPSLRGIDYPGFDGKSGLMIPDTRKSLALIRPEADFIWYNLNSKELNIFQTPKGGVNL